MEELFRFSKALRYSQLVQLKKKIVSAGGDCSFVHKYLMEITLGDAFLYLFTPPISPIKAASISLGYLLITLGNFLITFPLNSLVTSYL